MVHVSEPLLAVRAWHPGVAQWQVLPVFTPQECAHWVSVIDGLRPAWLQRAPAPISFYTLGAATYLDAAVPEQYAQRSEQFNPMLQQHFGPLYARLIDTLGAVVGPMAPAPGLALPGFHLHGEARGERMNELSCRYMEQPVGSVHVDMPYRPHRSCWTQFAQVDFVDTLTFTVCLQAPTHGAGLNVWGELDIPCDAPANEMPTGRFAPQLLGQAQLYPYQVGGVHFFRGHLVHQMAPGIRLQVTDRRVTLQGHAVRADGVWRMFF